MNWFELFAEWPTFLALAWIHGWFWAMRQMGLNWSSQ